MVLLCLSVCQFACLSLCLSVSVPLFLSLSLCVSLSLSVSFFSSFVFSSECCASFSFNTYWVWKKGDMLDVVVYIFFFLHYCVVLQGSWFGSAIIPSYFGHWQFIQWQVVVEKKRNKWLWLKFSWSRYSLRDCFKCLIGLELFMS